MFCIYHRVDFDGQCSAAIIRRKFPDIKLVPYQYRDEIDLEQFRDQEVIAVDISLQPFKRMRELAKISNLVWIDHHATALEEHIKRPMPLLDSNLSNDEKAGCELAWEWAFPNESTPRAVYLLGRYDVWDLDASDDIMPFQYGMKSRETEPTSDIWKKLFRGSLVMDIIRDGKRVHEYARSENAKICASSFDATMHGLDLLCLNTCGLGSQTFDSKWDPKKYDAMCVFHNVRNECWTISLYTDKDGIDVGAIAKRNGGGGHKGAAGWQTDVLPKKLAPPIGKKDG